MGELSRKQFLVSEENLAKLSSLSAVHSISEAEIVRRAIDAYDPNGENEKEAEAMLTQMAEALKTALDSVDRANTNVVELLHQLGNDQANRGVVDSTLVEIKNNPGWMDELGSMLRKNKQEDAA